MMIGTGRKSWLLHGSICLALAGLTLVFMGRVVGNDFINVDDNVYVTSNPDVYRGLSWASVQYAFTTKDASMWLPVTWLSLQLDAGLYWPKSTSADPDLAAMEMASPVAASTAAWGFHLMNLVLHTCNVLLVYALLSRLTGAFLRSAMVAALFAVHPLHVESVAWITERKDMLSTLFMLLAMIAYVGYARRGALGRYLLVAVLFGLGLASKPMVITFPFLLLLLDYWPLRRLAWRAEGRKPPDDMIRGLTPLGPPWRVIGEKIPFFVMSASIAWLTFHLHHSQGGVGVQATATLEQRVCRPLQAYGWYLEETIAPTSLGLFYPLHPLKFVSAEVLLPLILLMVVSAAVIWKMRTRPALFVGWLWFIGALFPVSGIVQAGTANLDDRFTYVPHIGLFVMIVWLVADFLQRPSWPARVRLAVGTVLAAIVLTPLAVLTWQQVRYWEDTETVMQRSILAVTGNHLAFEYLASHYLQRGDFANAVKTANQGLLSQKDCYQCYSLLYRGYEGLGQGYENERMTSLRKAALLHEKHLQKEAGGAYSYFQLGTFFFKAGDTDKAIRYLKHSLKLDDKQGPVHDYLGYVLLYAGRIDEAIEEHALAQQLLPSAADPWNNMGRALGRKNEWAKAAQCFQKAKELNPNFVFFRCNLAFAYEHLGKTHESTEEYRQAMDLDARLAPNPLPKEWLPWPQRVSRQAMYQAQYTGPGPRDLAEALEFATQACQADTTHDPELEKNRAAIEQMLKGR